MAVQKKVKIFAVTVIILVLAGAVIFAVMRITGEKKANIIKILPEEADVRIADFVFTEVGQDNIRWEVKAKTAQYQKKRNLALFDQVHLKLTTPEGKTFVMTGDQGEMLTDKKDVEIKGHVVIISDTGEKFLTDHLSYNDAQKKIYTDAPVVMESDRMTLRGIGLSILINKGELTLSSGVKAKIY
ncbi:MAG TPA: LPS export ABC transporter periplasmic protein LptC [Syntrophaceae bacterium]|jgi:LPS export ABC transporter protein LptC|nr:LPS export ABC transporter periplasmic protein LptC [Smithellaceae bacterium]HBJ75101.1 LPS export ABC transporter periplasmic protein LptC [Syntrophaceae bacterium]HBL53252.1 LPS export ABC transporter periplasmic protein LptC [Syntrophaceae bacterium]HCS78037.1 LPS export ABC transporter periplasmic protein LptC [Syntrophaceae bacterium]HCX02722.1 LPS export ABC transporter periplasmic protein LptC [Syntrophaceae bacterium]